MLVIPLPDNIFLLASLGLFVIVLIIRLVRWVISIILG